MEVVKGDSGATARPPRPGVINTMDSSSRLGLGDRRTTCLHKKSVRKPEGGECPRGAVVASKKKKKKKKKRKRKEEENEVRGG
jgi:hypothetical protein